MHRLGLIDPGLRSFRTRDGVGAIISAPKHEGLPILESRFEVAPEGFAPTQMHHGWCGGIPCKVLSRRVVIVNAAIICVQTTDQPASLLVRSKCPISELFSVCLDFRDR